MRLELGAEPVAMRASRGRCAQARSASGGWAQGRIFSVGDSLPSRGGWPRGRSPLGCDLCLLSVASQKVGAPRGSSGGEERVIFSPRGLGPARLEGKIRRAPTGRFAGLSGEKAVVEVQVAGIGTRNGQRPTVPAGVSLGREKPNKTPCGCGSSAERHPGAGESKPVVDPPSPEARARALFSPRYPDRAETYKETDEPTYT